jgi:tetratricopeptide (TPR) repeat protein
LVLGRKEEALTKFCEAIASYDHALAIKPDDANVFDNKACCYSLWGQPDDALTCLARAVELAPDEYRQLAQDDADFDSLRNDPRFQALINAPDSSATTC